MLNDKSRVRHVRLLCAQQQQYLQLFVHDGCHLPGHGLQLLLDGPHGGAVELLSGHGSQVVEVGKELGGGGGGGGGETRLGTAAPADGISWEQQAGWAYCLLEEGEGKRTRLVMQA